MFDIFNRKKIKELEEKLEKTNDRVKVLDESLRVYERIIKYAKDEPSYWLQRYREFCSIGLHKEVFVLHLYIDKEEYIIELEELSTINSYAYRKNHEFSVDGNIATFGVREKYHILKFIIDYKEGKYIYIAEPIPVEDNNPGVINTIKCGEEVIYDSSKNDNV